MACQSTSPSEARVGDGHVGRSSDLRAVADAVPTSVASQLVRASADDAFVPDYRCGAVPAFHRVPSCDACNAGEPTQC